MSDSLGQKKFQVLLVENNPYDRAVLDACFEADPKASLQYTIKSANGALRAIGPADLWSLCADDQHPPDLILLDLALTKRCGVALADSTYRAFLRKVSLLPAAYALSKWDALERPFLVRATLALAGLESGVAEGKEALRVLVTEYEGNARSEQQRKVVQGLVEAIEGSRPRTVLEKLWDGKVNTETVVRLSEAPSVLYLFVCVTAFPNSCFGVVSHYADEDTKFALRTILGFRNRCANLSDLNGILDKLILNKASLFGGVAGSGTSLTGRLREAHYLWHLHQSPEAAVAPFGMLPVITPDNQEFELGKCVDEIWPGALLSGKTLAGSPVSTVVVWDETRFVVGRENAWKASPVDGGSHLGWQAILKKGVSNLQATDVSSILEFPKVFPADRPVCYVVQESVNNEMQARRFALDVLVDFPSTPRAIVLLGGSPAARRAFSDGLNGRTGVALYHIPGWKDKTWNTCRCPKLLEWLRGRSNPNGRRNVTEVMARMVQELRVQHPSGSEMRRFGDALEGLEQVGGSQESRNLVAKLSGAISAAPDRLEKWVLFEAKAEEFLRRAANRESLADVLRDLKLIGEESSAL